MVEWVNVDKSDTFARFSMSVKTQKKRFRYPYGKVRVYLSVTMTVLSIILALLLLKSLVSFLYYLGLTIVLAAVVLVLKMRFLYVKMPESSEERLSEAESTMQNWKALLILFGVLIMSMLLPLLLARFHPEIWFIGLISYVSGVSVAEVLFFLVSRR